MLCGCSKGNASVPRTTAPRTTTASASAKGNRNLPTEQQVVDTIGVSRHELPSLYRTSNTMKAGNEVFTQVTLNLCGATFASETLRTASHQVFYLARDHHSSISTETVAYTAGGATQAMREIKHALATCPSSYVPLHVAGAPLVKQGFIRLPDHPGWEPSSIAVRVRQTSQDGRHDSGILIYQRRNNLLSGTYAFGAPSPSLQLETRCALLLVKQLDQAQSVRQETQ